MGVEIHERVAKSKVRLSIWTDSTRKVSPSSTINLKWITINPVKMTFQK